MKQLTHQEVKNKQYHTSANFIFWLDNISNPANFAMIFRLADSLNIKELIFREHRNKKIDIEKVKKISHVPHPCFEINKVTNFFESQKNYEIIGIEITDNSIPYFEYRYKPKTIFVVGNEKSGISQNILDICDKTVEIPMLGSISSLNVAQSLSIITTYANIPYMDTLRQDRRT